MLIAGLTVGSLAGLLTVVPYSLALTNRAVSRGTC
jgi:hypothetical protein